MKPELQQYHVSPGAFWQALPMMGVDGYDAIELAEHRKWTVISAWGKEGWDLGSWPYVIVFFRNIKDGPFQVIEYVEGDVTQYDCPSEEVRNHITDEVAFFHWKATGKGWVNDYESVEVLPAELRGPYWGRAKSIRIGKTEEACSCNACVADQQSMQKEY